MSDPEAPPPHLSPTTSGTEVTAEARLVLQMPATSMDIQAPSPDLGPMAAQAQANAHAWQAQIGPLMDSPQGYGGDGFTVAGGNAAGADGDWPTDVSFPHAGP